MPKYRKEINETEKEKIIKEFLPFIKYTAHRLSWGLPPQLSVDDLISVGVMGLLDALQRYTEGRVKLNTFVQFRIKGAMLDELRANNWVPKSMTKKISNVKNAHQKLEKEYGRLPEDKEVTEYLGISIEEYYRILQVANTQKTYRFEDVNEKIQSNDDLDMMECISDPDSKTPLDILEENEQKKLLASVIEKMPEKEKLILSLYYWEEMTMKEIAHIMNLTEGRVCQLHSQAIIRLKAKLNGEKPQNKCKEAVLAEK
ncbi:MAG: FliA/WhiG family RNA polymerase sigma factor [Nitrospirae bacterium]|jgi:RNA polymerase sigma factor for flagellar operon FliA|nr:FliA/WhiG family RNA polymerase sigma factor [Nitrospirota bacterium]